MFKQKHLIRACALALAGGYIMPAVAAQVCIGNNLAAGTASAAAAPSVKIVREVSPPTLRAGESMKLGAQLQPAESTAALVWCVSGEGENVGTLTALNENLSQVKYTAPAEVAADQVVKVVAKIAGTQQGSGTADTLQLSVLAGTAATTPAADAADKPSAETAEAAVTTTAADGADESSAETAEAAVTTTAADGADRPSAETAEAAVTTTAADGADESSDELAETGFTVSGIITDQEGKPLAGVMVEIAGNSALTAEDGRYTIAGLAAGTYELTASKDGYTFAPVQVALDGDNAAVTADLRSVGVASLAQLAVATRACEAGEGSEQVVLFDRTPEPIYSFASHVTSAYGTRIFPLDLDQDKAADLLLISKILQGNSVALFDFLGNHLDEITLPGTDFGVNLAFPNWDETTATALSAPQAGGDTVSVWRLGRNTAQLKLLGRPGAFNLAVGDIDGDGTDELVLTLAETSDKPNVGIFDQRGNLLKYFSALSADRSTPGLVVTLADVNGDGKAEIIVGTAEGNQFEVGVYSGDGSLQKRFAAFPPASATPRAARKVVLCHNGHTISVSESALPAHLAHGDTEGACPLPITGGVDDSAATTTAPTPTCPTPRHGVLLTSGDLDEDGTPEIIVSRNGGQEIRTFSGTGQLLNSFRGVDVDDDAQVITSLAYGTDMKLAVPEVGALPLPGEPLRTGDYGGSSQQPVDIGDREVTGRINLQYAVVGKLVIKVGAQVNIGVGVRFKHVKDIPAGLDVSNALPKIQSRYHRAPALNLAYNVANDAPPLLQSVQVALGNLPVQQSQVTGNLTIVNNYTHTTYVVRPVRLKQARPGMRPGVHWSSKRATLVIVTHDEQEVEVVPVMNDLNVFIRSLADINLINLQVDENGQMRADPIYEPRVYYVGVADAELEEAAADEPLGLVPEHSIFFRPGNAILRTLVFVDSHGKKRRQRVYPRPAHPQLLLSQTTYEFEVYLDGTISFVWNGRFYQGLLSYGVLSGAFVPASGNVEFYQVNDINGDDVADFEIVYPNGDRQIVYTLPE